MRKLILIVLVVILIALAGLFGIRFLSGEDNWICSNGQWIKHGNPSAPKPTKPCGEVKAFSGEIVSIYDKSRIDIKNTDGSEISLAIADDTKITDGSGSPVSMADLYNGFTISGNGGISGENSLDATEIKIVSSPGIIVYSPKSGDEVGLPLVITGVVRVFENQFNYRLKDVNGSVLVSGPAQGIGEGEMSQYKELRIEVSYPAPKGTKGIVEVFDYSAKDGSEIDKVVVPIVFGNVESTTLKVYFGNSVKDPGGLNCNKTYPTDRRIAKTDAPARVAVEEMLAGPTNEEKAKGFFSSISYDPEIGIQSLTIDKGVAKIDFSAALDKQSGGSCRVSAIRSQITNTLKQFSTVKSVVISIDGRTEDILQP